MTHCEESKCLYEYQARDIHLCQQSNDCPKLFLKYDEQTNEAITTVMEKYSVEAPDTCKPTLAYNNPEQVQKNMIYPWYQGDVSYYNITLGVGNDYGGISDLYMYFLTSMSPTKIKEENTVLSFEMPQKRPWMTWPISGAMQQYSFDSSFLSS